jgi:hypothetical protein
MPICWCPLSLGLLPPSLLLPTVALRLLWCGSIVRRSRFHTPSTLLNAPVVLCARVSDVPLLFLFLFLLLSVGLRGGAVRSVAPPALPTTHTSTDTGYAHTVATSSEEGSGLRRTGGAVRVMRPSVSTAGAGAGALGPPKRAPAPASGYDSHGTIIHPIPSPHPSHSPLTHLISPHHQPPTLAGCGWAGAVCVLHWLLVPMRRGWVGTR